MTRTATILIVMTCLTTSSCDPIYYYTIRKSTFEYERYPTFDFGHAKVEILAECIPRGLVRPDIILTITPSVPLRLNLDRFALIVDGDSSGVRLSDRWINDSLGDGLLEPGNKVRFAVEPSSNDPKFLRPEQMEFIMDVIVAEQDTVISYFHLRRDDFQTR